MVWAKQFTGKLFDGGLAVTADAAGNIYATGYFSSTTDFDPGPGIFNLTAVNAEDIFVAKLSPNGNLLWAKAIGDFRYQAGYAITLDVSGNIIVTGIFFGTVDFDPGPGETKLTSAGNEDVFVLKLNSNGDFIWAKKTGGPTNDFSNSITTDKSGNIYFTGYFDGTANFNTGTGVQLLASQGLTDAYICKLSSVGELLWVKGIGGNSTETAFSIGIDNENNVYATGFFFGSADFNPGPAVYTLQASGFGDGFVIKLNASGDFIAALRAGGNEMVRFTSLKVDTFTNRLFIGGYFDGNANFDIGNSNFTLSAVKGEEDAVIAQYDFDMKLVWAKQFTGPSFQRINGIDADEGGNVYTTGYFDVSADFDPGPQQQIFSAKGTPDAFVCKLDASGNYKWAAQAKGNLFECGYSVKVTKQNDILVTGTFHDTTDFDPGPSTENLTALGESEVFLWKIKQCSAAPAAVNLNVTACTKYTLNGNTYSSTGTYQQAVVNSSGCDSLLITLNLNINRAVNTIAIQICQGASWFAGGRLQTKTGVYIDTLKTASGCDSILTTLLTVTPAPRPWLGANRPICAGQPLILNPGKFTTYLWQDGSTSPLYNVINAGNYSVTVTDANNCKAKAAVQILNPEPVPADFLPAGITLCNGNSKIIEVTGYKNYLWSDGSTTPKKIITAGGVYTLTVTDFNNCPGSDTITVIAGNCISTGIPNAFTPGADGKNDYFRPMINLPFSQYRLLIFDRTGTKIFETNDYNKGWDGTLANKQPAATGNYVYQITFISNNGKPLLYKGNVLLLR